MLFLRLFYISCLLWSVVCHVFGQQALMPSDIISGKKNQIINIKGNISLRDAKQSDIRKLSAKDYLPITLYLGDELMVTKGNVAILNIYGREVILSNDTDGWYKIPLPVRNQGEYIRKTTENAVRPAGARGDTNFIPIDKLLDTYGNIWMTLNLNQVTDKGKRQEILTTLPPYILITDDNKNYDIRLSLLNDKEWQLIRSSGSIAATITQDNFKTSLLHAVQAEQVFQGIKELENSYKQSKVQLGITLYKVTIDGDVNKLHIKQIDPIVPENGEYKIPDGTLIVISITNNGRDEIRFELFDFENTGAACSVWPVDETQNNKVPATGKPFILGANANAQGISGQIIKVKKTCDFDIYKIIAVSTAATDIIAKDQWNTVSVKVRVTD